MATLEEAQVRFMQAVLRQGALRGHPEAVTRLSPGELWDSFCVHKSQGTEESLQNFIQLARIQLESKPDEKQPDAPAPTEAKDKKFVRTERRTENEHHVTKDGFDADAVLDCPPKLQKLRNEFSLGMLGTLAGIKGIPISIKRSKRLRKPKAKTPPSTPTPAIVVTKS